LDAATLDLQQQLVVFEAQECHFCEQFKADILDQWQAEVKIASTLSREPPTGWKLQKNLFATPTIVLFKQGREVTRFTGYNGDKKKFWQWLEAYQEKSQPEAISGYHPS
jgi:peptide methionine sulfoxide reductase msrA/msrB